MNKIKTGIIKGYRSVYFPFFIFAIGMLFFNSNIVLGTGDDVIFLEQTQNANLFSWLAARYNGWSSRVIIEFFLAVLVQAQPLWRILHIAVMVLGVVSIAKLFGGRSTRTLNWFIASLFLLIPTQMYLGAGWIATSLNYTWPLSFCLFAMIPIRRIFDGKKIKWYMSLGHFLAFLYAINMELTCAILLAVYGIFTVYYFIIKRKINWFMAIFTLAAVSGILFIFLCPGNAARKSAEIATWFPDYGNLSFLRKVEMGFSSALFEFVFEPNLIFTFFSLLLIIGVFIKTTQLRLRFVACIPLTVSFLFGLFAEVFSTVLSGIGQVKGAMTPYGTGVSLFSPLTWVPDGILLAVCLSIIVCLFVVFDYKPHAFLATFIVLLGFASKFVMAFSPTIWASGSRTSLFMYGSLIICAAMLYAVAIKENKTNVIHTLKYSAFVLASLSLIGIS